MLIIICARICNIVVILHRFGGYDIVARECRRDSQGRSEDLEKARLQVEILLKYKESVPDRTKITVEFGAIGVHVS